MKLRRRAGFLGMWLAWISTAHGFAVERLTASGANHLLELNFVGVCSTAWVEDFRFYTETLGMRAHSVRDHWVLLGAGWDDYVTGRSRALVCEVFEANGVTPRSDAPRPAPQVPMRLGIQVAELEPVVASLQSRGVRFDSAVQSIGALRRVGFSSPSGTPWVLWSEAGQPAPRTLAEPAITTLELQVRNVARSRRFYREMFGLSEEVSAKPGVSLAQVTGGPRLILLPGGTRRRVTAKGSGDPALAQPHFLGFMAADVREAAGRLRWAGVRQVREVTHHDWGGTDLLVADPDGNVVQVFQLDEPRHFGMESPR